MSNQAEQGHSSQALSRSLSARHLTMIAIGGSIGTGLFVASGASIAAAGPGGALIAYSFIGIMVYFLMTSLGELASFIPLSGSFATYAIRFVDPAVGFALGWNYWYNWAITIAVELVASSILMKYWFPEIPGIIWSASFLAIILSFNLISVKGFGEAEYWFSLLKVVTVIAFILTGALLIFQRFSTDAAAGFENFFIEEAPFAGGFSALLGVAMIAGFSFQGTELVGIAAAESVDPARNIPRAIKQIFWRILLFYILSMVVISFLIPYTAPELLKNELTDVSESPFTLIFKHSGFIASASLMNAIILSAVLSAGNSGMYASTRMLYTMAVNKMAPACFAKLSRRGIPVYALYATAVVSMCCFFSSYFGQQRVYLWLLNASGLTGFIAWLGIALAHYRFRKGYILQGRKLEELPYRAKFFPFGPIFAACLCLCIALGQEYEMFLSAKKVDWIHLLGAYAAIPIFVLLWLIYKVKYKTKWIAYKSMEF